MRTTGTDEQTGPSGTIVPLSVKLLLPRAAADIAGVCRQTLRRHAEKGDLTIVETLGGHARYLEDEILALRATKHGIPAEAVA
jgi:hypothetical protein